MDAPHSIEIPSSQPVFGRALRALAELDGSSKLAIVCVLLGWFLMNTLVVTLGSLQHGVRFFDMSAIIADPTRLFFDVDAPFHRIFFGSVCVLGVAAPLAPHVVKKKIAWFGYLAPLALMLLCGALLYSRTSGEFFTSPGEANSMTGSLIRFANNLVRHGTDLVSRHISVGAGGYLAMIASVVLAVQGVRRFRHAIAI